MKVESHSLCHVMRSRESISNGISRLEGVRNHLIEPTIKSTNSNKTAQGKKSSNDPGTFKIPSRHWRFGSKVVKPTNCRDTTEARKRAANGFMCTQQIRTSNRIHLKLSRRRKACGTILTLRCVRERCGYSQSCATRTLEQLILILLSKMTTPRWNQ